MTEITQDIFNKVILSLSDIAEKTDAEKERIKTNLPILDTMLCGGMAKGQLILLQGQTGQGKSTFGSFITSEVIRQGKKVLLYSGEMEAQEVRRILDLQLSSVNEVEKISDYKYKVKDKVCTELHEVYKDKAFIINHYDIEQTKENIFDFMEAAVDKLGIEFIFVDNLMSIVDSQVESEDYLRAQTYITEQLNTLAIKKNIIILLVVHEKKPINGIDNGGIYGSYGSSNISNKAHTIMTYNRIEGQGFIYIYKNRHGEGRLTTKNNPIIAKYNPINKIFTQ